MQLLKERYVRWVGVFLVAFLVMQIDDGHLDHEPLWYQYFVSWVFTAVYWNGAYLIFMLFRKTFPEIRQTIQRLIVTYLILFIWMTVGGVPVKLGLGLTTWQEVMKLHTYVEFLLTNLVIALIVGTLYETVYFFENWRDAIRQNEELKNRQIRTQFEVLQNQMSPHFLFNSLNTLTTLIAESQETAINFTQKLSDVYRYILQNKEKELVILEAELTFAQDYLYLLQMRYPDNLSTEFRIRPTALRQHIAPLTIQMLIENCIKHNVISKADPLEILIYVDEHQQLVVENNLQRKNAIEKSTKTGLTNIRRRYEYLANRKIFVSDTDGRFRVAVPLIEVRNAKDLMDSYESTNH